MPKPIKYAIYWRDKRDAVRIETIRSKKALPVMQRLITNSPLRNRTYPVVTKKVIGPN
jgi:hypothetical protein